MEFAHIEVSQVEEANAQASAERQIRELSDLQLAAIGGGIGDVIVG
jgi:hypothetical protein